MTIKTTSRRICPGLYAVTAPGVDGEVEVVQFTRDADGTDYDYWMAKALWDQYLYSDPCQTKREAMACAVSMLEDRA